MEVEDIVKITRGKDTETTTLDLKKFKKQNFMMYESVLGMYPKITKRKGVLRIVDLKK